MFLLSSVVILIAAGAQPAGRPGVADSCYHYRPASVSLTGRLIQRRLPGPPNYESIARGDRPQVVDLLILDAPICTIPDYKDSPNTDAFQGQDTDRKSTRLNSSHQIISYAVFCLKKKTNKDDT